MIDVEVERLRRLRGSALQLRAVARALGNNKWTRDDVLLREGRCAAWRVARTVSGRLRSHPNARCQQDAGLGTLLKNSIVATAVSLTSSSRMRAMSEYGAQLKAVMRELDDARALTWAADLSDTFGRSQREIRALIEAVDGETHDRRDRKANASARAPRAAAVVSGNSPFLTI